MDLTSPAVLRALLDRHGLGAKKSLGQHFLCSASVVRAIVARTEGFKGVLEIGPGPGVLTRPVSEAAEKTIALELDPRMREVLHESAPKAEIREADALEADLRAILSELPGPRVVVSNLPYYITGPLITRIAEARKHWNRAILMMQKEVATRVLAPPMNSDRGSLSVYLQLQFAIEKVGEAPAGAFLPPPKVDSTVLQFTPVDVGLEPTEEEGAFRLIRSAFRQPRKTLANNLASAGYTREQAHRAMAEAGIQERARPADPDLEAWRRLYRALQP